MTVSDVTRRLATAVAAENAALAAGDPAAAAAALPEKLAAAEAFRTALPRLQPTAAEAQALHDALQENDRRLATALEVQAQILELVGRAARDAAPAATRYGRRGTTASGNAPSALARQA